MSGLSGAGRTAFAPTVTTLLRATAGGAIIYESNGSGDAKDSRCRSGNQADGCAPMRCSSAWQRCVCTAVPTHIRSDNGPEFAAKAVRQWLQ